MFQESISELHKKKTPANVSFPGLFFPKIEVISASCKQRYKPNCRTVALLQCGSIYSSVVHDVNMFMMLIDILQDTPLIGRVVFENGREECLRPFSSKDQQALTVRREVLMEKTIKFSVYWCRSAVSSFGLNTKSLVLPHTTLLLHPLPPPPHAALPALPSLEAGENALRPAPPTNQQHLTSEKTRQLDLIFEQNWGQFFVEVKKPPNLAIRKRSNLGGI